MPTRRQSHRAARPDRIGEEARQRDGYERPVRADLILLVDQLEELFAADVSPAERTAFVALLRHMAESGRIWVLATLRADLYERFLAEPDLLALKSAGATYDLAARAGRISGNRPQAGGSRRSRVRTRPAHRRRARRAAAARSRSAGHAAAASARVESLIRKPGGDGRRKPA
jgi:hypothetical protein